MPCEKGRRKIRILGNLRRYSCGSGRECRHQKDLDNLESEVPILCLELGLGCCRLAGQLGNIYDMSVGRYSYGSTVYPHLKILGT